MLSQSRYVILAIIIGILLFFCSHPLIPSQFGHTSDEGYYFTYSKMISEKGLGVFDELFDWYAGSDEARKHPAPIRVGYLLPTSTMFTLFGPSYEALGLVSSVSFLLFLGVCFYFCRKHFDSNTALVFLLFLVSSPLMLGMGRRALADSLSNLCWGLAIWLFLDFLSKRTTIKYIVFLISLMVCLLVKEMSVVLFVFFVFFAAIGRRYYKLEITNAQIVGIVIWPVLVVGFIYTLIFKGNLIAVIGALIQTHLYVVNPYALNYSSGPWYRYLVDFILLSPITTLLFLGYAFHLIAQRLKDWKKAYFFAYFFITYIVLNFLSHSKVVRFVINLDMVISLFAVLMLWELSTIFKERFRERFIIYLAIFIATLNFKSFLDIFYLSGLLDPISAHLLMLRGFIPAY